MSTRPWDSFLNWFLEWNRPPIRFTSRDLVLGLVTGFTFSLSSASLALFFQDRRHRKAIARIPPRPIEVKSGEIKSGVIGLIGNTPLIRINSLSDALGVEILGKAEFLNPGGSVKDRVALRIIEDAEEKGLLVPNTGSTIFEGTVGSTGISIATVGRAKGYECCIIMPDDVAIEKVEILEKLGAKVERVRPASIVDEKQFVNLARTRALEFGKTKLLDSQGTGEDIAVSTEAGPDEIAQEDAATSRAGAVDALDTSARGFFADQFENENNYQAHFRGTGPEIWRQCNGRIDSFVSGAGTGGTISGVAAYLHSQDPDITIVLADPEGSGLFNKVKYGVMFDEKEREGRKRRHQVDTVVEGIGINRITRNFELGSSLIDDAYRISDPQAIAMSRHLLLHDGLYLGSSSACNLVAACRLARTMEKGSVVVTILCDSGVRHGSKFWSDEYLRKNGIPISDDISDLL